MPKALPAQQKKFKFKRGDMVTQKAGGSTFRIEYRFIDVDTGVPMYRGYDFILYYGDIIDEHYDLA